MMQDTHQSENDDMYSRLMAISQEALESGYYETAYHTLCAAMHYAYTLGDSDRLQAVQQAGKRQLDWIDTHASKHRMSSESSIKRSGVNMYNSLLTQVNADLLILKQQKRRKDTTFGKSK
ncbi:hypothetical protein HW132_14590 [Brasilonema sp. CT11]|nr:hypothetical protein [Brasilonema sp. CT11]